MKTEESAQTSSIAHDRARLARLEIDNRYYSDLSCRVLGKIARLSASALVRSFVKVYGISPHQYLTRVRIQRAKKLIESSRQPLDAISAAVGFKSAAAMANAFLLLEKVPISAYCRSARLGLDTPSVG